MKLAMTENIHVRSFREFIENRLPEALAAVIPLRDYRAEWTGDGKGRVTFGVGDKGLQVAFDNLLFPRADGSFALGSGRVVVMTASSNNLEEADVKTVGEQLMDLIGPRLAALPAEAEWDEALLRAWFPLDKWLHELIRGSAPAAYGIPAGQWLDDINPLATQTHLRRILVLGADVSFHPSQVGRVCPYDTPEGPNCGRVLTLAVGADVQDGRIVPAQDRQEGTLGLAATLVPLLCHNDPGQQLMAVGRMRQWVPQAEPELPLVRSGNEPEDGTFSPGRNFLTAYLHWRGMNYEDAIVMSESAAARLASPPWVLEVGDKLSNRHGAKGVVGAILPDDQMPHLPDGRAVELLFDPMGVYSRLSFGQMIEAAMGLAAEKRGEPVIAPPFRRTTPDELHTLLREAGLPESGQFVLRDGKDGPEFDEPTTVGIVYWGKTVHLARAKVHFASPDTAANRQRAGRNEYLALRAVGADHNILDAYSTRAVLGEEAKTLHVNVGAGFLTEHGAPPSPAFRRLQRALRTAMVDLAWQGDKVTAAWATPDEGDLALAEAMEHPWRRDGQVTHVRPAQEDPESFTFESTRASVVAISRHVLEQNERLAEALKSVLPEAVVGAARAALQRSVRELAANLVAPEDLGCNARMQFSGRAALAPGYDLKLGQVGLPEDIAWGLFGPLVGHWVGPAHVLERGDRVKRQIERVMKDSLVIINRAPTWEPTAITAFAPVMVGGRAILLHPLCCRMFNADFDGDQAAVWLPVSQPAQREAKEKLTIAGHLRRDPSVVMYHLTPSHAVMGGLAYACESEAGLAEFEAQWPADSSPPHGGLTRATLIARLLALYEANGADTVLEVLNRLYRLGIKWATKSGASFSPFVGEGLRLPPPPASTYSAVWEAYRQVVDAEIAAQADSDPTLRAPMRAVRSGARGSVAAIRATIGPWTVSAPYVPENPIRGGFRDGLCPEELWILAAKTRAKFLDVHESQVELAVSLRLVAPEGATLLRRAMASDKPGEVFAEAADAGETDPLTDPDVRAWVGLPPDRG